MRYLVRPLRVWVQYWPQLAALYLLGVLGRRGAIEWAAWAGYDNHWWASLIMPLAGYQAARGDMSAFSQVSDQVAALMGHGGEHVSLQSLARLVGDGRGLDPSSPGFQQLLGALEGELAKNPEQVARVAEQFFGGAVSHKDEDE